MNSVYLCFETHQHTEHVPLALLDLKICSSGHPPFLCQQTQNLQIMSSSGKYRKRIKVCIIQYEVGLNLYLMLDAFQSSNVVLRSARQVLWQRWISIRTSRGLAFKHSAPKRPIRLELYGFLVNLPPSEVAAILLYRNLHFTPAF